MPSNGEINVLVIPVVVSDYKSNATEKVRTDLEKAMFGKSEDTGWESLSSYYEKSSHGALKINGKVTDWYNPNLTSAQMVKKNNNDDYTDKLLSDAVSWYKSKYNDDCTQYDNNKDGYIDGVFLIYSAYDFATGEELGKTLDENLFWAYTTMDYNAESNLKSPNGGYYFWASYDFLYEGYGTDKVDSHTFVHETGHMLSLTDYYSYTTKDKNGYNIYSPMGGVDMMDFNIGDHDAYSKYFLGWLKPTVLTQEYLSANDYKLTLNSQNESGEAFLLPTYKDGSINYNGTPFDEYLLIEYYTPTGLNYQDSLKPYENNLSTYSQSGILVYHINATVGKLLPDSNSSIIWDGCAYDKLPSYSSNWGYTFLYSLIYNNTASRGYDTNLKDEGMSYYRGRLISLLPATGKRINGQKTGYSTNSSLYKKGTEFGKEVYDEFRFDDGTKSQYTFKVESTSDKNCTLKFGDNI